jgi:uncharacterized membrane protein
MTAWTLSRAVHVLAVVMWIGGVGFVTTVLLPAVRELPPAQQWPMFERMERRFAAQARIWVLLAFGSAWELLRQSGGWARVPHTPWLLLMLLAWIPFFVMLFLLEPLVLDRFLRARAERDPVGTMRIAVRMHVVLLALSVSAVVAGVIGAHGGWPPT